MAVSVGEVISVLKFIAGLLEDAIPADYSKADFDILIDELKSLEITFQRALMIDSKDLQQLMKEDQIGHQLEEIRTDLEKTEECPVARNDPKMDKLADDLHYKEGKTLDEANAVAFYRTLVQCVSHDADAHIKDALKQAGYHTKDCAKTIVGAPLAPLVGLVAAGIGAGFSSQYNGHKTDISNKLKNLTRKLKSIGRRIDHFLLVINTADTAYMKKTIKKFEDKLN